MSFGHSLCNLVVDFDVAEWPVVPAVERKISQKEVESIESNVIGSQQHRIVIEGSSP